MDVPAIQQLIAQGDTEAALEAVMLMTKGTPWKKEALLLAATYQAIRRDQRLGFSNESEDRQKISKINYALLEMLETFEKNGPVLPKNRRLPIPDKKYWLPVIIVLIALSAVLGYWMFAGRWKADQIYNFQYKSEGLPIDLQREIDSIQKAGQIIRSIAFGPNYEWTILYGRNKYLQNGNLAASIQAELETWRNMDAEFRGLVLGEHSDFFLWFDKNSFRHPLQPQNFPSNLLDSLYLYNQQMREIKDVAVGPNDCWIILWGFNGYSWQRVPDALAQHFKQAVQTGKPLKEIALSRTGGWVLLSDYNTYYYGSIDNKLRKTLEELSKKQKELLQVYIKDHQEWIVIYK